MATPASTDAAARPALGQWTGTRIGSLPPRAEWRRLRRLGAGAAGVGDSIGSRAALRAASPDPDDHQIVPCRVPGGLPREDVLGVLGERLGRRVPASGPSPGRGRARARRRGNPARDARGVGLLVDDAVHDPGIVGAKKAACPVSSV